MFRPIALAALATAAVLSAALLHGEDTSPAPAYVAHEWGTFTSMQGSDGVTLEGLQHEEEGLPDFVYSRTEVRNCPRRRSGGRSGSGGSGRWGRVAGAETVQRFGRHSTRLPISVPASSRGSQAA